MKVLIVNKFLHPNGGSETYIFKLGNELVKQGHQVQYFGMEHSDRIVGNRINVYTNNMDFHEKKKKIIYSIKTIYSIEARKKIRLVLNDYQPDIVHLNNFNYQLTPSIIIEINNWRKKKNNNCKIIYTAHDYQLLCPNHLFYNQKLHRPCDNCIQGKYISCVIGKCIHGSFLKSLVGAFEGYYWKKRKVYKNIDKIVCPSEFIKRKFDEIDIFRPKTITIHNFVEHEKINIPKNVKNMKYILYFGRYSKEKGILSMLDVCKSLPNIFFVFAGKGEYENEVNMLSNAYNAGFLNQDELSQTIKNALFSVTPSECYDNCPYSVLESQKLSTPVLAANIGGIPELINDGIDGKLFESGNNEDLRNKIEYLWNNEDVVEKYRSVLKEKKFTNIEKYIEIIYRD